jgi:zinc protease
MARVIDRSRLRRAVLGAVSLLILAPGAEGAVRPPKLTYDLFKLPNGLQVILHEDRSTPIVNLQVWYHVGSKDERPGRTGFAHLFEHMMFKGSRNVEPEAHTSWIASIGGQANAQTFEDTTVFWETVPAQYMPLVVWLEADRMASLRVSDQAFKTEREVVKEERRQKVDNQPYGRLNEIIYDQAFQAHPYKHPVNGSLADLEAASIEDVREFHRTYYRPDNATLVLAGDFDAQKAKDLISSYFGRVPKPAQALRRDIPKEPPLGKLKRVALEEDWPLPAVVVAHHITFDGHPDSYPLHIAAKILSDGLSSRIYRRLVYQEGLALTAFGDANLIEHPNLFYAVAIVAPGQSPEKVEKALTEELERLGREAVSDRELTRSKNQFARDYIAARQTIYGKATQLAHAVVIHNDITTADGEFDIFNNMPATEVQRVARTYFTPDKRVVLTILPRGQRPATGASAQDGKADGRAR